MDARALHAKTERQLDKPLTPALAALSARASSGSVWRDRGAACSHDSRARVARIHDRARGAKIRA